MFRARTANEKIQTVSVSRDSSVKNARVFFSVLEIKRKKDFVASRLHKRRVLARVFTVFSREVLSRVFDKLSVAHAFYKTNLVRKSLSSIFIYKCMSHLREESSQILAYYQQRKQRTLKQKAM